MGELSIDNDSTIEIDYTPYEERLETYIVPILFLIIFVVGVLGNGTLVVIFLRHRSMRNVPNTFIFSLALADLLVIITCVPFTSILYTLESYPWGVAVCKISESAKDISIGVSVYTLTALSVERYYAIANPLRRLQKKSVAILAALLIWLLAIAFALPDAVFSRLDEVEIDSNKTITFCSPFPNISDVDVYAKYNVFSKSLVYYVIPLSVIACFYILMAIRLHASANEMPGDVKVFFICFLPHHVFMLWFHFYPNAKNSYNYWWHALKMIGFCLSFVNSCVNPIALYWGSGVFRSYFNKYLCCKNLEWSRNAQSNRDYDSNLNSTLRRRDQVTLTSIVCESQSLQDAYNPQHRQEVTIHS
ncbi:neuropeptide CCHamide-2 receptor-like isoform X2 [Cylas formicarius]|uniref:neuropeptide CCHamide-2 receptor-like isoform X2 n=1 Tax=Cylas formicarius TaxID=197179 RepID=UPI0029587B78|nr:neuropeptide CCHamide-2 receptor-like isoform X2 [Cylas formicarius]